MRVEKISLSPSKKDLNISLADSFVYARMNFLNRFLPFSKSSFLFSLPRFSCRKDDIRLFSVEEIEVSTLFEGIVATVSEENLRYKLRLREVSKFDFHTRRPVSPARRAAPSAVIIMSRQKTTVGVAESRDTRPEERVSFCAQAETSSTRPPARPCNVESLHRFFELCAYEMVVKTAARRYTHFDVVMRWEGVESWHFLGGRRRSGRGATPLLTADGCGILSCPPGTRLLHCVVLFGRGAGPGVHLVVVVFRTRVSSSQ
ncbi:hypothetical protein ACFE04_008650 [Oxalis oulophora]